MKNDQNSDLFNGFNIKSTSCSFLKKLATACDSPGLQKEQRTCAQEFPTQLKVGSGPSNGPSGSTEAIVWPWSENPHYFKRHKTIYLQKYNCLQNQLRWYCQEQLAQLPFLCVWLRRAFPVVALSALGFHFQIRLIEA